jgi:hypothetical protein
MATGVDDCVLIIEAAGIYKAKCGFYFEPVFRVSLPAPGGKASSQLCTANLWLSLI